MKNQIFTLILIAIAFAASATVHTVNNNPTIAQFTTIQAAVNVAVSGDTIYVHGSQSNYAGATITNKQLVIMGPGFSPDKNPAFTATITSVITFTGTGCNNSEVQGLNFAGAGINLQTGTPPSGMRIIRNRFSDAQGIGVETANTYSNYLVEGNYFDNGWINAAESGTYTNWIIRNNLFFKTSGNGCACSIADFLLTPSSVLIDHNLFYGTQSAFGNTKNLIITNNIFYKRDAGSGTQLSTFSNNIDSIGGSAPWTVNNNIDGGGNIHNQDPQMADQVSVRNSVSNPLLNFTIASGPANNSAGDGKDMGLLYDASGPLNWANSRHSRLPRIYNMSVTNPNLPSGGTLNVVVEGRKSN